MNKYNIEDSELLFPIVYEQVFNQITRVLLVESQRMAGYSAFNKAKNILFKLAEEEYEKTINK